MMCLSGTETWAKAYSMDLRERVVVAVQDGQVIAVVSPPVLGAAADGVGGETALRAARWLWASR